MRKERRMRLIDADGLKARLKEYCVDGDTDIEKYYEIMGIDECIDETPTVDAVEVVRCKDCKRCKIQSWYEIDRKVTLYYCKEYKFYKDSDDYCSFGERKEE